MAVWDMCYDGTPQGARREDGFRTYFKWVLRKKAPFRLNLKVS